MTYEVEHFLELEEKLRTINSEIQGFEEGKINKDVYELSKQGYYDFWKFKELMDTVDEVRVGLYDVDEMQRFIEFKEAIWTLIDWSEALLEWKDIACRREDGFAKCELIPSKQFLDYQERMEAAGMKCGFISPSDDKISIIKAIDSFTNCLHTFTLEASKYISAATEIKEETDGICDILVLPSEENKDVLLEACRTFAFYVENNQSEYIAADYDRQRGYIVGDRLQIEIGGYRGHRSEIDLRSMEFEYYEHDWTRGNAVKYALEKGLGLECAERHDSIWCKLNTKEDAIKIARFLAFLPSLDVRIDDLVSDIRYEMVDECVDKCESSPSEKIRNECEEHCRNVCGSEDEECFLDCELECTIHECTNRCYDEINEKFEKKLQPCVNMALLDVVRKYIDYYSDVIEDIKECIGI